MKPILFPVWLHLLLAMGGFASLCFNAVAAPKAAASKPAKASKLSEFQTYWQKRPELDVLFFEDDLYPPVKGRIKSWDRQNLVMERGEQSKEFPLDQVRAIDLHRDENETQRRESASLDFLREACEWRKIVISKLDHQEHAWIQSYLERLLLQPFSVEHLADLQWVRKTFAQELGPAWKTFLEEWMAQRSQHGETSESPKFAEAKHFIEQGHWVPRNLMRPYLEILAKHEHQNRLNLEKENPKWMEDDEVKPLRQRHLNLSLDMQLYAFLFESDWVEASSQGLLEAGKIAFETGDLTHARHWWNDVVRRYRDSPQAKEALAWIAKLPPPEPKASPDSPTAAIPEKPSDAEPPTLMRFSIFEE